MADLRTTRRRLQLRLIFLVYFIACPQLQARTQVDFDYYDIEASNGQEMLSEIAARAPDGFSGYTHWAISYQFATSKRSGDCRLISTDVSLSIRYQMPNWKNEAQADSVLRTRWNGWYAALLAHEEGHGAHGMAAYESINTQFSRISSEPDCAALGAKLADIVSQTTSEYLNKDIEFDKLTQHGESQGAGLVNLLDEQDRAPAMAAALEADESSPLKKGLKFLGLFVLLFLVKRKVMG